MSEILLDDAPQKAKELFNKGFVALERNNLDYACDMFLAALDICPGLLQARKFLRAAEIRQFKAKKGGKLTHLISSASGMPAYLKTMGFVKAGKAEKALAAAEDLLRVDPLNLRFVLAFAEAASLDELPEAAVQTLEIARDHYPENADLLKSLAENYTLVGNTRAAQKTWERLCELHPNDPELLKAMKDAMAMDSIQKDGWGESADSGGSFRNMVKDTKEAQLLEQAGKAVKTDKDADDLIEDTLAKIEAAPDNINFRRNLARLYTQKRMFDEAVAALETAFELSSGDPEVDAALSRARVQKFDMEISTLTDADDAEGAASKEQEKAQFQFDDLQARVERYPNDLALRFDLAVMLFTNDYINEAIQQLQLAQRNPQNRVKALYYLGMCFKAKEQYDMAVEQLEAATQDLTQMDDSKKDITYELGVIAEVMGDRDKAGAYFKQIYQSDIGYRDVAAKVEEVYSS